MLLAGCFDVPLWFRSHFIWKRSLILIEIRLLSRQFSHAMCNDLVRGNLSQHDLLSCFNVGVITRWLMSDNKDEQTNVRRGPCRTNGAHPRHAMASIAGRSWPNPWHMSSGSLLYQEPFWARAHRQISDLQMQTRSEPLCLSRAAQCW